MIICVSVAADDRSVAMITMRCSASALVVLLAVLCRHASGYNPKPNAKSVVEVGGARFTLLTERLIRMEWGGANDAATFAFLNRDLPTPNFDVSKDGDTTVIQTPNLKVRVSLAHALEREAGLVHVRGQLIINISNVKHTR